jgi:hypothetical protein
VLGDVGPAELALAPCLSELKVLELDRCEIQLSGARWLVNAPFLDSLRQLNVNNNSFAPEGLYRLLEKKPPFLHTLLMIDNDLGDEGAAHLAESPGSAPLLNVNLARNGLSDEAAKILGKSKHLKNLLILRLQNNEISRQARAALADSPLGKRLAILVAPVIDVHQTCPECGAAMQLRQGRSGYFLGCSTYPRCRGTLPVPPEVLALVQERLV